MTPEIILINNIILIINIVKIIMIKSHPLNVSKDLVELLSFLRGRLRQQLSEVARFYL